MNAREKLLKARELVESVMAELDMTVIDCPCEAHTKHYRNWSDAQLHAQLGAVSLKLYRSAGGASIAQLSEDTRR